MTMRCMNTLTNSKSYGFIGVGAMGQGMVMNLSRYHDVVVFDKSKDQIEQFNNLITPAHKITIAKDISQVAEQCSTIFMSLPSENSSKEVMFGDGGLVDTWRKFTDTDTRTIVDHGTFSRSFALSSELACSEQGKLIIRYIVSRYMKPIAIHF